MISAAVPRPRGATVIAPLPPRFFDDPTRLSARLVRAGVFAGAGTLLAIAAHRVGGGAIPTGSAQLVALGALFTLGLAISRRERSGRCLGPLVVGSQLAVHTGFALFGMHSSGAGRGPMWDMVFLCHPIGHAPTPTQLAAARASVSGLQLPHAASPESMNQLGAMALLMLGAHLLAAAALGWWLRKGERTAWAAAGHVAAAIRSATDGWYSPVGRAIIVVAERTCSLSSQAWREQLQGRGPPTLGRSVIVLHSLSQA